MTSPRFVADPPDARRLVDLDGVALIFHRPSGQTHIVAPPAPEILAALGEGEADADTLMARLRRNHDIVDANDLADALALADEKVALAQAAYDLIDAHITRLDRDLRTFDQALLEREAAEAAAAGIKPSTPGGTGGGGVQTEKEGGAPRANEAAPVDPNEPRYCVCQRVSFGPMIACDNENCDMDWFHYSCVGLSTEAKFKGNWYCPACTAERRRLKKLEAKEAAAAAKK